MTLAAGNADIESELSQLRLDAAVQALAMLQSARRMKGQPLRAVMPHSILERRHELRQQLAQIARQHTDPRRLPGILGVSRQCMPVLLDRKTASRGGAHNGGHAVR